MVRLIDMATPLTFDPMNMLRPQKYIIKTTMYGLGETPDTWIDLWT